MMLLRGDIAGIDLRVLQDLARLLGAGLGEEPESSVEVRLLGGHGSAVRVLSGPVVVSMATLIPRIIVANFLMLTSCSVVSMSFPWNGWPFRILRCTSSVSTKADSPWLPASP